MYCEMLQCSVLVVATTILLSLPSEIGCCFTNNLDINSFMSKPNYQNDPCYIQWQSAQPKQMWPHQLEMSLFDRIRMEREQVALQQSYPSTNKQTTKNTRNELAATLRMVSLILGGISLVGFCLALFLHYIGCGKRSEPDRVSDVPGNGNLTEVVTSSGTPNNQTAHTSTL